MRAPRAGTEGSDWLENSDTERVGSLLVTAVYEGLDHPWGMAFLPDGSLLVTERPGRLVWIGGGGVATVGGTPDVAAVGQGGLLDVAPHPEFGEGDNRWVYLTYAKATRKGFATAVGRGHLLEGGSSGPALVRWQELFVMDAPTESTRHFGSRIIFGPEGYLYMTVGDRGSRDRAQDPMDHAGSTLRFAADGTPAGVVAEQSDAVRISSRAATIGQDALPSIFAIGHRNAQGMAVHPEVVLPVTYWGPTSIAAACTGWSRRDRKGAVIGCACGCGGYRLRPPWPRLKNRLKTMSVAP